MYQELHEEKITWYVRVLILKLKSRSGRKKLV